MNVLAIVSGILNVLITIPKIADMVSNIVTAIVTWWVNRQNTNTMILIADAAALGARAQNDDERYASAALWQKALSQPKVSA